ncbi:phosphotransferase enzyme family protein [Sphaerisporangium aureirubrum]|uniref:Phosphotransferase enzyme family protein n=1 Tax=Sphaerisporangium aureirubrum TaxID=1544736 RepID=A0ABW1NLS4_9ACTN
MRDQPMDVDEGALLGALKEWGLAPETVTYAPVGFGDHHWIARASGGDRWFVTVADLPGKTYCGDGADAAFGGLRMAMDTTWHLSERAGLPFVVAPLRTPDGETVLRLGQRYGLSVFPYADGAPGEFGQALTPEERAPVIDMLAVLHGTATPAPVPVARLELPARAELEEALAEAHSPWHGGPYAEPARALTAEHAAGLRRRLSEFDRRAAAVRGEPVVTHGEPHPGNVLRAPGGALLVDWDTVGLAPPERDLWLVAAEPADLDRYAYATGRHLDPSVLTLYRLRWSLADVSLFLSYFRSSHGRTADAEQSWAGLTGTVEWLTTSG